MKLPNPLNKLSNLIENTLPLRMRPAGEKNNGFTLIELLIVIGILAILLAIVLVAINPNRQFAQARNAQRRSDVNAILNAVHQYGADNRGTYPTGLTTAAQTMASSGGLDICSSLVTTYLAALPYDPSTGSFSSCSSYNTGYTVLKSSANRITVAAPSAENSETITVSR